jgi:hypothetical protein
MSHRFLNSGLSDYVEGAYELTPMQFEITNGKADEYPVVAPLGLSLDASTLRADFARACDGLSAKYLEDREPHLLHPLGDIFSALRDTGFTLEHYRAIGLMKVGTNELLDGVPAYTAGLLRQLAPMCRAHYVIAEPGTEIKPHIDCRDYSTHGFRIHIPLLNSAFYTFYIDGEEREFELTAGTAWFVNNAILHSACNRTSSPRVSILLQMMSDRKLFSLLPQRARD